MLVHTLEATEKAEPKMKALVFTSFTSFIDLIEDVLCHSETLCDKFLRLDGKMRLAERAAALQQFQSDPNKKIFLLSMKVCCVL